MSEVKFERENRYIVIKRSDLLKVPVNYRKYLVDPLFQLKAHLPRRECLVLESDWPEYELVWKMTEFRDNAAKKITRMRAEITAAEQRIAHMEAALKYYADKDHFSTDDGLNWDSCSGEPSNILWHEEQPWFIEDGSIARAALNPNPEAESHE